MKKAMKCDSVRNNFGARPQVTQWRNRPVFLRLTRRLGAAATICAWLSSSHSLTAQPTISRLFLDATNVVIAFTSAHRPISQITLQSKPHLDALGWNRVEAATLADLGAGRYEITLPRSGQQAQFYRIHVEESRSDAGILDPSHLTTIEVDMDADDWVSLGGDTRFGLGLTLAEVSQAFYAIRGQCAVPWPDGYRWFPANLTVDGVRLFPVGIRRKGFIGSLSVDRKPALKIKTDKYVEGQFLGDTERITLNNNAGDTTGIFACLAYQVFTAAGYPAPRCNLASVRVNGQDMGPYTNIEAIKKSFLERAFGDDSGSLYEGIFTDFVAEWLPRWETQTSDTDPARRPLAFVAEALCVSDAQLVESLNSVLNIDRYITYWALEVILDHGDSYSAARNNFYVYFDPTDGGRAVFIPWGIDKLPNANATKADIGRFLYAEVPRRLSRIPQMADAMLGEIDRLMREVWDVHRLLESIDSLDALARQAGRGDSASVQTIRSWIQTRPTVISELIARGMPISAENKAPCLADKPDGGGKPDGKP